MDVLIYEYTKPTSQDPTMSRRSQKKKADKISDIRRLVNEQTKIRNVNDLTNTH